MSKILLNYRLINYMRKMSMLSSIVFPFHTAIRTVDCLHFHKKVEGHN